MMRPLMKLQPSVQTAKHGNLLRKIESMSKDVHLLNMGLYVRYIPRYNHSSHYLGLSSSHLTLIHFSRSTLWNVKWTLNPCCVYPNHLWEYINNFRVIKCSHLVIFINNISSFIIDGQIPYTLLVITFYCHLNKRCTR